MRDAAEEAVISRQVEAIRALMADGVWRTLREITKYTGFPEASVSADLRSLRKKKYGAHKVDRRIRVGRVSEYQVGERGFVVKNRRTSPAPSREALDRAILEIWQMLGSDRPSDAMLAVIRWMENKNPEVLDVANEASIPSPVNGDRRLRDPDPRRQVPLWEPPGGR